MMTFRSAEDGIDRGVPIRAAGPFAVEAYLRNLLALHTVDPRPALGE
jgi:hypothetical protein